MAERETAATVVEIGNPTTEAVDTAQKRISPGGSDTQRRLLKALVIGPVLKQELTTGKTKELPTEDFLESLSADGRIVSPPFDKLVLAMLPENSTELQQVIEAMVVNIEGFGHRLDPIVDMDAASDKIKEQVFQEKIRLTNFLNNCCVDDSFVGMRRKKRYDKESTGEAFWEVIRDITGKIVGLNHVPSYQVRLGVIDKDFTVFERPARVIKSDGTIALEMMKVQKRFRRYIQAKIGLISRSFAESRGMKVRWFKEFGDPRVIDYDTGEIVPTEQVEKFPVEKRAGELIHFRLYNPRTPYGVPRYTGNLITIFGDRASDEINFITLRNNNVPSMMVLVSNGMLTEATIERIREYVETQISGMDNYSRFLIVEAEGAVEGPDQGHVKIDVKPLQDTQNRDQLFQEYSKNNREKIREAFRLPPIFVGRSEDYTRATAESSRRLADEQVFKPERDEFDNWMNKVLLPCMDISLIRFVSNGPNVTDDEDLIKVLAAAEKTGALTPRIAHRILEDIMGQELPSPDKETVKMDIPFSLQMAEAVKNQAAMEVGTQVTALKSLVGKVLLNSPTKSIVKDLLAIREQLEGELNRRLSEGG